MPDEIVKVGRPQVLSSDRMDRGLQLIAMGTPHQEVAQLLGVSRQTLWRYLKHPEVKDSLDAWRETFKIAILQRAAEGTIQRAFDLANHAIIDKDAKSFDAATRGIAALEKTTASASGEAKKFEMTGPDGEPLQIDIRAILARATGA